MPIFTLLPRHTWIDHSTEVDTGRPALYTLLRDIDHWPDWTPGLKAIRRLGRAHGLARPGDWFLMTLDAPLLRYLPLPCVMVRNDPDCIEWGAGLLGSRIRHRFELSPLGPHRTRLRHVECASGLLALAAWPAAGFARMHDLRWSRAIEARFATAPRQGKEGPLRAA